VLSPIRSPLLFEQDEMLQVVGTKPHSSTMFSTTSLVSFILENITFNCKMFFCNSKMTLSIGSKTITRSQRDYFGKGLKVLYPKKNFYMGMNF